MKITIFIPGKEDLELNYTNTDVIVNGERYASYTPYEVVFNRTQSDLGIIKILNGETIGNITFPSGKGSFKADLSSHSIIDMDSGKICAKFDTYPIGAIASYIVYLHLCSKNQQIVTQPKRKIKLKQMSNTKLSGKSTVRSVSRRCIKAESDTTQKSIIPPVINHTEIKPNSELPKKEEIKPQIETSEPNVESKLEKTQPKVEPIKQPIKIEPPPIEEYIPKEFEYKKEDFEYEKENENDFSYENDSFKISIPSGESNSDSDASGCLWVIILGVIFAIAISMIPKSWQDIPKYLAKGDTGLTTCLFSSILAAIIAVGASIFNDIITALKAYLVTCSISVIINSFIQIGDIWDGTYEFCGIIIIDIPLAIFASLLGQFQFAFPIGIGVLIVCGIIHLVKNSK